MENKTAAEVIALVESLRKNHQECEDGFYSCPKHESYFGSDNRDFCDCGADDQNETVTKILAALPSIVETDTIGGRNRA